jgi:hypothetical protein
LSKLTRSAWVKRSYLAAADATGDFAVAPLAPGVTAAMLAVRATAPATATRLEICLTVMQAP